MSFEAVIPFLAVLIVLLFLLFSAFLLSVKTKKKLSNQLLASFLMVTAIDVSAFFYHQHIQLPLALEMLRNSISAFKNPLLFLYILSVIYADFKLKRKHLVHLLPWIITILVLTPNFFLVNEEAKKLFFENYNSFLEIQFLDSLGDALSFAYLLAEVYYIARYRKLLLENFTEKKSFYKLYLVKTVSYIALYWSGINLD